MQRGARSACVFRRAPDFRVRPGVAHPWPGCGADHGPRDETTPLNPKAAPMKLLRNTLPLLALALVPALASATIAPAPEPMARLAEREALALRLEGTWSMDLART